MVFLVFFLATVLLLQTVIFSPLAFAQSTNDDIQIPSWFKTNAKWWKEDRISDIEIINSIQNLVERGIIKLDTKNIQSEFTESNVPVSSSTEKMQIPSFIKQVFEFWEEGSVSDTEVANAIKFLIEEKIIITQISSIPKQEEKSPIIEQPSQSPKQEGKSAAIIDQLHDSLPNESFQKRAKQYLEYAGYNVDIYTTNDITVDFFKKLPSMNYEFIYIRTHSLEDPDSEYPTFLFTGEKNDGQSYIQEQLFKQVGIGMPIYEQELAALSENYELTLDKAYFVVGAKLIDELMVGEFPKSVIIIGGCESVRSNDLADALISRGAASVIGWDRTISVAENDKAMLVLLEELLIKKAVIRDSISSVMEKFGSDSEVSPQLRYLHR